MKTMVSPVVQVQIMYLRKSKLYKGKGEKMQNIQELKILKS